MTRTHIVRLLVQILSKLLISCILFAEQIKAFMESVTLDRRGRFGWVTLFFVVMSIDNIIFIDANNSPSGHFSATPVSKKDKELESQSRVTRIRHQSVSQKNQR